MNPTQEQYYQASIHYCNNLLSALENDKDTIRDCFHGEPLQAYLKSTDEAISQVRKLKRSLQNLQMLQLQSM